MAGKPPLLDANKVAAPLPESSANFTTQDLLGPYDWFARSDRIWARIMPNYHRLTEHGLWVALLESAKADEL